VIWALFGIHKAQKIQSPDGYNLIALISLLGMTLIVLSIARRWSKKMVR